MPKRKKTRQNQPRSKKPMLPEGDLNTSMTLDERKQKLDVYLHDFDSQVKERVKKMKARSHNLICKIKGAYTLEIMRLPMNIRKMTLKEYFAQGGELGDAAMAEAAKLVSEMTNSMFQSDASGMRTAFTDVSNTLPCTPVQVTGNISQVKKNAADSATEAVISLSTSSRSTRSKKRNASPSSALGSHTRTKLPKVQEDVMMMPPTALPPSSSRCRSKKRNASPSSTLGSHKQTKLLKVQEDVMIMPPTALPPSSSRRSSRRNQSKGQFTPATRGGKQSCFNTPAITPKFDPRLPITPFLREAKPGERIMSLTGSPVVNHSEPKTGAHMYIPLGNGRTFHLNSEINFSPSQGSALNDVARQNIEMLQKQLCKLLKFPAQPKAK